MAKSINLPKKRVTIIQRVLPHYRIALYRRLEETLHKNGIAFNLIYGQENVGEVPKTMMVEYPWATYCANVYFNIFGQELVWQKIPPQYLETELVIVEQANRMLNNYPLLFSRRPGRKLAFWGHGRNMQTAGKNFKEGIKQKLANKVDWWFAYTDISKQELCRNGFPTDRITTVNNTIDTVKLQQDLAQVTRQQIKDIYSCYGIRAPHLTCLYCGGLYPDKKLAFLLASGEKINRALPEFSLIVVGSGPEEKNIKEAAARFDWLHYAGAKFGGELAPFLKCAQALLMPGLVGLVIIDSFTAGVPLFTTDNTIHSPEIAYLRHGDNGMMTPYDEDAYSNAVISYLKGDSSDLSQGSLRSANEYTLEHMIAHFAAGIEQCLSMGRR